MQIRRGDALTLMLGHCAGILFLISLPLWLGTLVSSMGLSLPQAGGLLTLYMVAAALASLVCAPRMGRLPTRRVVVGGYGLSALLLALAPWQPHWGWLAPLLGLAGLANGAALSLVHGTLGRSDNPHRGYAMAGTALGLAAIAFLGGMPLAVARWGAPALFGMQALLCAAAAGAALWRFPAPDPVAGPAVRAPAAPLTRAVWFAIGAVALMGATQAMTLSLFERIGQARGFDLEQRALALAGLGLATLLPAPLAGLLQRRLTPTTVVCTTPALQALLAWLITHSLEWHWYAPAGWLMEFNILFTHTFAFGLLAMLDRSGRAVAATPAMVMLGAALGPALGSVLAQARGFEAVGVAAGGLVLLQLLLFHLTRLRLRSRPIPSLDTSIS